MSKRAFSPKRVTDMDSRLRHIESELTAWTGQLIGTLIEGRATFGGYAGQNVGEDQLPETDVAFDTGEGHNHDGSNSRVITLTGDVTGDDVTSVVAKVRGITAPTPAATDDRKYLAYLHGSLAYVLHGIQRRTVTKTGNYTITLDDGFVAVDATAGAVTITLPTAAAAAGFEFIVKKIDASANAVTLDGDGAETIDGAATLSLPTQYASAAVLSDGTTWWVV